MPDITLSFTVSAFIVILLALIAVAVSVFFYRHTVPPIPRSRKIVLIVLRSIALTLLLVFLFEPLLRFVSTSTQKPVLAVLVDDSKSMSIKDRTGDRSEILKRFLSEKGFKNPSDEIRLYKFGTKPQQIEASTIDSLRIDEGATDITAALRKVAEEKDRSNIGAALLISDGSYNLGQNPLYEAEAFGIPLFTVGIGDSTEQKDVLITKVLTNELVYNQTEVPVDVTIKSSGFKAEEVEVVLWEGSKELSRSQLTLEDGTREYAVRLSYTPEGEGIKKYSVRVSRLAGELTTTNNQRTFFTRILKSKLRILMIAGSPSPDVSVLKQTLREDKNLDVRSLTQRSSSAFYEGSMTAQLLDSSDCILFIGFPIASTGNAVIDLVRTSIARKSTPVFYVDGKNVDEQKLTSLGSFLPFTRVNTSPTEQLVFAEPSAAQKNHPILAAAPEVAGENLAGWKRLPPLFKTQTVYKAKAEATVLATTKINAIVLNDPLILIRNVNKQKSLAVLGYGLWRWRLMAQGVPETEKLLATFLSNSIRWLTTRDDNRPVKVTPTKTAFTQGEPIEFVGQVYDASANPVENAQVKLLAQQQGKESAETNLRPVGNGRYEGTLEGLGEGDYSFKAVASSDGQPLGEDKGRFSVGELALEFQDTRMNVQLLRQLAARTGGEFYTPADFPDIFSRLKNLPSFVPRDIHQAREFELWNWKYMLALVVLLFAVEWFVRKRSGML